MKISLRPHHFLCLQGYKGLNYSKTTALSWSRIAKTLNDAPDTDILIIKGKDDLCAKCPAIINKNKARCVEKSVNKLDKKVQKILGIITGQVYKYNEITEKMQNIMTKEKHEELCKDCAWWKKGLCKENFK